MTSPLRAGEPGVDALSANAPGTLRSSGAAEALAAAPLAPLHPAAAAALTRALEHGWADPGALHGPGRAARALLDGAREQIAGVLRCRPDEVFFASSGPAAAQEVVLGVAASRRRTGAGVVASAVEHAAILHAAQWLGDARVVPVDGDGRVDPDGYAEALRSPGVVIGALQLANGEVGTLQPVGEVAARAGDVPLLVDATGSLGHLSVDVADLGVAHLTADARAFGAPPGVGIRIQRSGARWRRSGPDPADPPATPLIAAAAAALVAVDAERRDRADRDHRFTARLRDALAGAIPDLLVAGPSDPAARLPHLVTVSALYVDGEALVLALDRAGVGAASGSACTADTLEPSHVLAAMGFLTQGNLRIALGRDASERDVNALLETLPGVISAIRAEAGMTGL